VAGKAIPVGIPAEQVRMLEASIPLGRGATPEEAAGAIVLLCLPESNYISGQVLMCTGGL
jgi:3-oxoacyl-[acyl-carrier protein] reductase